ncbi:MAG: metallophosphoesterase [Polyangiaceae bacterium]
MTFILGALLVAGCGQASDEAELDGSDASVDATTDGSATDGSASTCTPCTESSECGPDAACVQYAGSDYCGRLCDQGACNANETCIEAFREDGTPVSVCAPSNGSCGSNGCGICAAGTTCDLISGECVEPEVDAGDDGGEEDLDAGVDAGPEPGADAGPEPGVDASGGQVSRLRFAVVGDTRPPGSDGTKNYPTKTITQIYKDFQALKPRPQFVIATGDYMFAKPQGSEGAKQLDLYVKARNNYSGTVFASLGNHECGGNNGNCAGATNNKSYNAFLNKLVKPLGKSKPYYAIKIDDVNGKWTSKFLITACNAWSSAQKTWLQNQLDKPTTYTFVARHQPMGSDAPCTTEMDKILKGAKYDMLLVGHRHFWEYTPSKRQLIEGLGGAPITRAGQQHGFATIHQLAGGGFRVRQYKAGSIAKPLKSFTVP